MTTTCPVCAREVDAQSAVCPYCGFKLCGSTLSFEPVGAAPETPRHVKRRCLNPSLKVLHGPQDGALFEIEEGKSVIGRDPKSDIFLNDMTVSRTHAILYRTGDVCSITDENSFNGLWVNNTAVEEYILNNGDIIQIGAFELLYETSF